jgi:hypothetical protein
MNLDLSGEFAFYLLVSWSCFVAGIWAIRYSHVPDLVYLGRYLIALCPIILSLFCNHSVSVCEQVILSKQNEAESVNGRVYLTSISRADLGDGFAWTTERYSDGTVRTSGQVCIAAGCPERDSDEAQGDHKGAAGSRRSLVPMQARSESLIDGADYRASVF